ncbi:MAG: malto-oligosyltrehalose synthase, partial [Nitrospinae bacterium]|nr:malto-oligosyltrehalose synthase [Nitrospinota bacterium]
MGALVNLEAITMAPIKQITFKKQTLQSVGILIIMLALFLSPITALADGIETFGEKLSVDPALFAELLERQFYHLVCWKAAAGKINYRRFFDVNDLAGLRVERPEVFAAVHELILNLIGDGKISGLRLDHVDGLFDPSGYFDRLQEAVLLQYASRDEVLQEIRPEVLQGYIRRRREKESGQQQKDFVLCPLFIVAEKILTGEEALPGRWAVHGTSGYDFLNDLNALFVDTANEKQFSDLYVHFTGLTDSFAEIVYRSKKEAMTSPLASELDTLTRSLHRISGKDCSYGNFAFDSLREALKEVVACMPFYRTYVDAERFDDEDRKTLEKTLARARLVNPSLQPEIFDFLQSVLLPVPGVVPDAQKLNFVIKLQQFTGPAQGKGLEDTAFYRYNRLISVNEVGGEPQRFGLSPSEFHVRNQKRQKRWPRTFSATATHDHKRGEDVRARINVLSEIPGEWEKTVHGWAAINQSKRIDVDGELAPDRNEEYLFYQTLLGVWTSRYENPAHLPELIERLVRYMDKAVKEAKVHGTWTDPNEAYGSAVERFIREVLDPAKDNPFLESFLAFQKRISPLGAVNSLAQVVFKIAAPGVPDFYQGTELWDLSLVDPDNRRPVDFTARRRALAELQRLLNGEIDAL